MARGRPSDDPLFSPTVFDDVVFGPISMGCPEEEVRRRVKRALKQVGMSGHERRSPHHLSVGEKKRIAIATVLSMSPEILVIDEPTSNLDPRGRWELIELLRGLLQHGQPGPTALVIATHDLEMVQALCQRAILLDEGQVVADDLTRRILSDSTLLASHGLAPPSPTSPTSDAPWARPAEFSGKGVGWSSATPPAARRSTSSTAPQVVSWPTIQSPTRRRCGSCCTRRGWGK